MTPAMQIFSTHFIGQMLQRLPQAISAKGDELGIQPAFAINGVAYYDAAAMEAISAAFRGTPGKAISDAT
jgi:hypothetical protein